MRNMPYDATMNEAIDNGDVLPFHTVLDVSEVYACLVLQFVDPCSYSGLNFGDKPDLFDCSKDLGVEVTQAIPPNNQEADALYAKFQREKDEQKRERLASRIEQVGGELCDWGLFGPNGTDNFDLIIKAFATKLNKLNSGSYKPFLHNHLYIRANICASNAMLVDALSRFTGINNKKTPFERIIISVPGRNYDFNLMEQSFAEYPFGFQEQYEIAVRARKIVLARQSHAAK